MSGSLLLWMTLALLLFWGVGLYNRLMRMRARGLSAFGSIERHLREYADLVRERPQSFQKGSVSGELDALEHALKDARANPLAIEPLLGLAEVLAQLRPVSGGLPSEEGDLAGSLFHAETRDHWDRVTHRVETSRIGYNQIMVKYNEALKQFPARLIVGVMGFKPGGLL